MINFFVNAEGSFGMEDYLGNRGTELADRVRIVRYEELTTLTTLPVTGTIFAAIDQAGPAAVNAANLIHDQISGAHPVVPILNHPRQSMQRYALLRRLFEIGCNRFNVIRATDDPSVSLETSAKAEAASRQTAVGAVSKPDGPGAVSRFRRSSGIAMTAGA